MGGVVVEVGVAVAVVRRRILVARLTWGWMLETTLGLGRGRIQGVLRVFIFCFEKVECKGGGGIWDVVITVCRGVTRCFGGEGGGGEVRRRVVAVAV